MREWGTPRQEDGLRGHYDLVQMLDIVNLEAGTAVSTLGVGGGGRARGGRVWWVRLPAAFGGAEGQGALVPPEGSLVDLTKCLAATAA